LSIAIKSSLLKIFVEDKLPSLMLPAIGLANQKSANLAATTLAETVREFLQRLKPQQVNPALVRIHFTSHCLVYLLPRHV